MKIAKFKKAIFILAVAASLSAASPAQAQIVDLEGLFTGVSDGIGLRLGNILEQLGISDKYITMFMEDVLGIHTPETATRIKEGLECDDCALQIPDLNQAEGNIKNILQDTGDLDKLQITRDNIQAGVVRSHADSILGAEGQQAMADTSEGIANSIARSSEYAREAQGRQVTQDVIKDLSLQQAELNYVLGQTQQSIDKLNVSTAYSNRVSAEMLKKAALQQQEAKDKEVARAQAEIEAISLFGAMMTTGETNSNCTTTDAEGRILTCEVED